MNAVKDLAGQRFGKLIAVKPTEKREARYTVWLCKCDCGNDCLVSSKHLIRGTVSNCGCIPKPNHKNGPIPMDLTGMTFGMLTVIERAESKNKRTAWLCRCSCGNEVVVTTQELRRGHKKSCGCKEYNKPHYKDLTGQRIGYLTILEKTDNRDYKGSVMWICLCDCGKKVQYSADALIHGRIKSCGCYREKEIQRKINDMLHRIDGTCIERLNTKKARSDNKCGHVGVHKVSDTCYRAQIGFRGKRYHLGTFSTLEEAVNARRVGEKIHLEYLEKYYMQNTEGK